jgi:large subunit ribosomal protein L24
VDLAGKMYGNGTKINKKPNKVHVRTGDTVVVLSGKDKYTGGKDGKGKVLKVLPDKGMVIVEGVNICSKHKKPRPPKQQGGILNVEMPIYSSKVMLVCDSCGKPTKIKKEVIENGEKVRICKKCNAEIKVKN